MRLPRPRITATGLAAALGGGVAAALLSMLTLQRPPLTVALGFVAPLPLMIAGLGFGWVAGLIGVSVGALFVGLFDVRVGHLVMPEGAQLGGAVLDSLVFFATLGLPAWVLSRLAAAPVAGHAKAAGEPLRAEELRLGRVASAASILSALSVALVFAVAIASNGGFDAFNAMMVATFQKMWESIAESRNLPKSLDLHQLAVQLNWTLPPMMSAGAVIFYTLNVWLAARIAQTSGLLEAPWPDIPRHLRVPRVATLLLAVSLGLSFTGGILGFGSRIVSAALLAALALQGLAVIHEATRGKSYRTPLLIIVYMTIVMLTPWPLVFWGLVGLLDTAFSFRDRRQPAVVRKP